MSLRWQMVGKYAVSAMLVAGLGAVVVFSRDRASGAPVAAEATAGKQAPDLAAVLQAPAAQIRFSTGLEALPQSLRGTDPPPGLVIDASGNLVVRHALRDFYDYFLSALGEESLATIRERVKAYMAKSLPPRADATAQHIFEGYVAYRVALQNVAQAGGKPAEQLDVAAVAAQKAQEASLRAQYLSPDVVAAFFGNDDAYDRYTLARLKLQSDKSLTARQKDEQMKALFQQLPQEMQASITSMQNLQKLQDINNSCQQHNCSPAELHQARAELVGAEAADRLQSLDEEQAAWKARIDAYLTQRAAIMSNQSFSDSDKAAQIRQLQQSGFNAQEQLRLSAYEPQA